MSKAWSTLKKGHAYEGIAAQHLIKHHYRLVEKNYRCRAGEIDLIALDERNNLVFVEVRYRASAEFGGALASVTATKQRRLRRAAQFYLLTHSQYRQHYCRFDVIGISHGGRAQNTPTIDWIRAAFN